MMMNHTDQFVVSAVDRLVATVRHYEEGCDLTREQAIARVRQESVAGPAVWDAVLRRLATLRGLSTDERALMTHVSMFGSKGYPVQKVGSNHWAYNFRTVTSARVYHTKREAVAAFEAYYDVLRDAKAWRI